MLRVLSVFGTRPEAIKMAPVVRELARHPDEFASRICVTGQHRQLLDQVLGLFALTPDHDLGVMREGQSPAQVAAAVLDRLEPVLRREHPDWVLVQGDTTTVAAAALAAYYARVRVGHVEAGLRTGDKWQPFPEEINRRLAGVLADLHFAPTAGARANLLRERVPAAAIRVTGNTGIDALSIVAALPYDPRQGPLAGLPWDRRLILITAHRRESHGAPLEGICAALLELARQHPEVQIVYPVHPNPEVRGPVERMLGGAPGITLLPPLEYRPLVYLLQHCYLVLTDSGGLQEEAPALGKPVLVLRALTERPEGVAAGNALLVGTDPPTIVRQTARLLDDPAAYRAMAQVRNPYGDGNAARRIVEAIRTCPW